MKKLLAIIVLLSSGLTAHCQQLFTHIPHRDYAKVVNSTEIGNHYFFYSTQSYYLSSILSGGAYIHKTNFAGDIVDSLIITDPLMPGILSIDNDNSLLSLYTIRGTKFSPSSFLPIEFSMGRIRYDSNFNFIDSFSVPIPPSGFRAGYGWYSKRHGERIFFVNEGQDTTIIDVNKTSERILVIDTLGNYIFDKALFSFPHKYTDLTTTNEGKNFILRFGGTDTPSSYTGGMYRLLDSNFNFTKWAPEPSNYVQGFNGLDRYSTDKFSMGFIKSASSSPLMDSFCVEIRDTNFNLIKLQCIPRHAALSGYPNIFGNAFDTRWFDGKDKNNIYIGNNWGFNHNLLPDSYFTLSNLDSNLNIRWSRVFGGDYPYNIERYVSTSDGGCLLMGIRRLGNDATDPREPVVFKVSQAGAITGITSFAPSAQAFFTTYPNPSKGICNIKNTSNTAYELLVFSQDGKIVFQQGAIHTELFSFDISAFASGTYFYKIMTKDGRSAGGKIIRE